MAVRCTRFLSPFFSGDTASMPHHVLMNGCHISASSCHRVHVLYSRYRQGVLWVIRLLYLVEYRHYFLRHDCHLVIIFGYGQQHNLLPVSLWLWPARWKHVGIEACQDIQEGRGPGEIKNYHLLYIVVYRLSDLISSLCIAHKISCRQVKVLVCACDAAVAVAVCRLMFCISSESTSCSQYLGYRFSGIPWAL